MIEMNILIIFEKSETPKIKIDIMPILSKSLYGVKSPNPTVDKDENEKYKEIIAYSELGNFFRSVTNH